MVAAGGLLGIHVLLWPGAEIVVFYMAFHWKPEVQVPISLLILAAVASVSESIFRRRSASLTPLLIRPPSTPALFRFQKAADAVVIQKSLDDGGAGGLTGFCPFVASFFPVFMNAALPSWLQSRLTKRCSGSGGQLRWLQSFSAFDGTGSS